MNRREFLMASLAASAGHWLAATVAQPILAVDPKDAVEAVR